MTGHIYIFLTVILTVYSQLVMRWQVTRAGALPEDFGGRAAFVLDLLLSPWVLSALAATFFSGIAWMLAMTKFELSYAYPYVSLNYLLVLTASVFLFHESVTATKVVGTLMVVAGIVVLARGG